MKPARKLLSAVSAAALAVTPAVGGAIAVSVGAVSVANAAVVQSISVRGNTRVASSTISEFVGFRAGKDYSAADLDEAVKRLFATGLFSDVHVTTSGPTLVVTVSELSIVNQVVFRGNRKLKDERLRAVVELQPRGAFDQTTLDADVQAIVDSYSRIGRNDVSVTAETVDLGENRVNVVFQIQEGDRSKISQINFIGNNAYGDRRLQSVISTKRSNPLSWLTRNDVYDEQRLAADEEQLRRFYFNHGYADFRVLSSSADVDPNSGNIVITIEVDEGEKYRFGNVEIDSTVSGIDADDLRRTVETRSGATYSGEDVEDTLIAMSERLAAEGFPFAEVTPVGNRNFETRTIDVSYVVDQGQRAFIERIEIVGNARTRDYVIRREFDLAEGDAFNQILLRRAQKRLEALDFFENVSISTRPGSAPDRVIIVVNAVDKPTGEFGIGAGYTTGSSTNSGPTFEASITERNFLGRGQALKIGAGGSADSRSYSVSFTEPYFLGYRLAATVAAFRRTQDYLGYDVATTGGSVGFGLPITQKLTGNIAYSYSQDDYDITDPTNAPQAIQDEITANGNTWTKSAINYGLTYNSIDDVQDPREGVYLRFNQEVAGLGGDARHIASTFDGRYYQTLSEEAELVGSLRVGGGTITGLGQDVRTVDHFRLGPRQIRGFAYNGIGPTQGAGGAGAGEQIGGKNYLHASAEAQFPLPAFPQDLGLKGAVFADAATLYGHDSAQAVNTSMEWRASAGVSLIWQSPFAPLRFDYAVPIKKEPTDEEQRFNFTVSTAF
ncbi:outer membrane protein assembly factor BamA [Oricola cellulosilytica]|uniref:Outer membrane protein assembly factor BamA n=1 Tax=Oricola cellulosilytica TaxID=1429082 RepID=A0A4R0P855_9HYPH|nr:outer membrane protein assembly factor BamA [Oricola cellulosilytica]TCD13209.1 outer membrane protein assembly factor BamA [Oricola cellulosilytica]